MSRGILQLEMEELQWNRKMLMDHMGYRNYRDINAFLDILITNKHVTCQKDGKIEWFRSSGPGNIWLCLLYTSPSPRDRQKSRMPSSA